MIPYITKDMRVLDFGAGHKDYATKLARMGYKIDAIEFYHRREGSNLIDEKEIRKDFATICEHLKGCITKIYKNMAYNYFPNEFSSYEDYVKYLKEKGLAIEVTEENNPYEN